MTRNVLMILLFLITGASEVYAAGTISGYVHAVQVRETGNIEVTLTENHINPDSCAQPNKLIFKNSFIGKKEALSIILSAMAQNKKTSYYVTVCEDAYGTNYPNAITASIINE